MALRFLEAGCNFASWLVMESLCFGNTRHLFPPFWALECNGVFKTVFTRPNAFSPQWCGKGLEFPAECARCSFWSTHVHQDKIHDQPLWAVSCNSWSTKIVCNNVENIAYIRTPPGFTRCAHLFQLSDVHTLKFLWLPRYIICSSSMWEFPDYYVTWALVVEESWEGEKQRACCGMERSSTLGKLGRVGCCRLKVAFWNMNGLSEHHHFWLASWFNFIHDA